MNSNKGEISEENNMLKAGLWYTISSISIKAIGIITTPLYTRLLSTSDYGKVITMTSWYSINSVFVVMALYYSIGRAKIDFPGKLNEYVGSLQLFSGLVTLILTIFCIVFIKPVSALLGMNKAYTLILLLYLMAEPAIILNQNKYKYQYKYKSNIAISVYITLATLGMSFALIFILPDRGIGRALGIVLSAAFLSLGMWISALKNGYIHWNTKYIVYGLKISVPLILHTISLSIMAQSDRLVITKFFGDTQTAIYSLAYQYAVLIDLVLNAVGQAWLPWFHDTYGTGHTELIREKVKPLVVLGGVVTIGAVAIAPEAMMILGPKDYQVGVWVVAPVAFGTFIKYLFQNYEHVELHIKKTWYISAATLVGAGANVVLNYYFVPRYGFIAAAYTTMVCYIFLMLAHNFVVRAILKQHVYSDCFFYLSSIVCGILCVGAVLLYPYVLVRYMSITAIVIVFLASNKTAIKEMLKKKKVKDKWKE